MYFIKGERKRIFKIHKMQLKLQIFINYNCSIMLIAVYCEFFLNLFSEKFPQFLFLANESNIQQFFLLFDVLFKWQWQPFNVFFPHQTLFRLFICRNRVVCLNQLLDWQSFEQIITFTAAQSTRQFIKFDFDCETWWSTINKAIFALNFSWFV